MSTFIKVLKKLNIGSIYIYEVEMGSYSYIFKDKFFQIFLPLAIEMAMLHYFPWIVVKEIQGLKKLLLFTTTFWIEFLISIQVYKNSNVVNTSTLIL